MAGFEESLGGSLSDRIDRQQYLSEWQRVTEVGIRDGKPVIESESLGPYDLDGQKAVPMEELTPEERMLIEALPELPNKRVCAPLTKEQIDKFGPGPIGYCDAKMPSELTPEQLEQARERRRVKLDPGDRVVRTSSGFIVLEPLPFQFR